MHGDDIRAGKPFELYHSTWRSRERYPALHTHDFYEFYLFLQGETTYIIEDYAHVLAPGDMIIVPPGKFHRAAFDDLEKPYERLLAYVSAEAMRSISTPGFSASAHIDSLVQTRSYCQPLSAEDVEAWQRLYRDAAADPLRPARQLTTLYQLSSLIIRLCDQRPTPQDLPAAGMIGPIISYINEHFCEDLTLEQLSQLFYMTPTHLSHQFRRYARLSVHQYITAKRMMLARTLLVQGHTPQEVSVQCGYQDYSSFYRAFMKAEGSAPRKYRDSRL